MAAHERPVEIRAGSGTIAGTLIAPATEMPGVLFVHGWGGSQEQYLARARKVAGLGCVCLTFDLTGHAATRSLYETVNRERNLEDLLAAYDLLTSQSMVDKRAIAVIGSSYGGYLAALLSEMRPVRWLGLRAPALYMDSGWELPKRELHRTQDLVAYRRTVVPAQSNRALRACAAFEGDVLVIGSELDMIVPHTVVTSYVDAFSRAESITYRTIRGADHGLTEEEAQRAYSTLLMNWLREMVTGARSGPVSPGARPNDPVAATKLLQRAVEPA
ncbi:alpha/beta hydrolase family protein [Cupriavidus malaysiensis]|uniref:Alpha/beta hydrolase n=1 Tax=Cupriavidus malaysiensis TaxID=367825 RepID=A0ABM6F3Q3_9BURK|nr:alpha/beta fold hydrolase [Cupriavidus malaysiensis]AOZ06022.1 alpha/beta hydrolase [Cupriavidus malaysiensis]